MAMPMPGELLTLEDWEALPEDNSVHYELQEGVLVVMPRPVREHQRASGRLETTFNEQLPFGLEAIRDFEVVVKPAWPPIVRAPDLVVVREDGASKRVDASEVLLVVEIISPGSRNVDMHLKMFEYADAGIPHYWLVDLDPPVPSITVFGMGAPDDGYRESQTATGQLIITEPFPLRVDINALLKRRSRIEPED